MKYISDNLLVILPLLSAILGSLITVIGSTIKEKRNRQKFENQVERIMKESCRRVIVYLQAIMSEEYEESLVNLKYRIEGIKIIDKLISDFKLNNIIGVQIYVVFRIREQVNELICDLENYNQNYFKIKQIEVDINHLIENSASKVNIKALENKKKNYTEKLKINYEKDLLRHVHYHLGMFQTLINNYYIIAEEIKNNNDHM